jgi:hypothetical protein
MRSNSERKLNPVVGNNLSPAPHIHPPINSIPEFPYQSPFQESKVDWSYGGSFVFGSNSNNKPQDLQ